MPRLSLTLRRKVRLIGEQPPAVRALGISLAMLLLIAVATVGGRLGSTHPAVAGSDGEQRVASSPAPGSTAGPGVSGTPAPGAPGAPGASGTARPGVSRGPSSGPGVSGRPGGSTSSAPGSTTSNGPSSRPSASDTALPGPKETQACTHSSSDQGVTGSTVKVVFPYFDLGPVLQVTGGSANTEKAQDAINAYVSEINAQGGIYCRKIDPIVVQFNPLDDTEMDVYCRKWAQDDKVFAVVDSDAWHSTHQLCLTQDHHIPLLTGLGLTEQWPQRGAPYLWYAGATAEMTVDNWALSAQQHGHLDSGHHIGVILSDREEEHIGGARLKADLARLGRTGDNAPVYEEVPYDAAQAQPFINKAVNDFKIAKVDRLFMMLPFTTFSTFVKTAEQQNFYPKYLVSDFQSNIVTAQAVLSQLYPRSMEGAEGPSMVRLGLYDDQKLGNYVAAERRCDAIWKKHEPANQRHAGHGGIAMRWCDHITQFAEALRLAGPDPTRQKWTAAIATVHGYAAAMTPTLTWNPGVYAGAQVVAEYVVHLGEGPGKCPHDVFYEDGNGNGSCHVMTEAYRPYRTFG